MKTVAEILDFIYGQGQIDSSLGGEKDQLEAAVHLYLSDFVESDEITKEEANEILQKCLKQVED
jgi:intergrase/recombinase